MLTVGDIKDRPENPFRNMHLYVNPDYARRASESLRKTSGNAFLNRRIGEATKHSTAIWLETVAAISRGGSRQHPGFRIHLHEALKQSERSGRGPVVTLVVYNLPGRDCAARASNGEFGPNDLHSYKHKFVDPIVDALNADSAYRAVKIAVIVEPDSLPNLVTNQNAAKCAAVVKSGAYVEGIKYVINELGSMQNVYLYLDIGHSGWLGWPSNMDKTVSLYADIIKSTEKSGKARIRGLATNVANYTPLVEPYLKSNNVNILRNTFYQWNPVFDEATFIRLLSKKFSEKGVRSLGFVTDTSRNGWRIRNDAKPIDQRTSRGSWCNVKMARIGEPPSALPRSNLLMLDANLWIKPPGESDGSSKPIPNDERKQYDSSCSPDDPNNDAQPDAPLAGHWFHAYFLRLLRDS